MDTLLTPSIETPYQDDFLAETIAALQLAIQAIADPETHAWPTLLLLVEFSQRLESMQAFEHLTPSQQSIQLMRISDENDCLRQEMQELVACLAGKLAARSVVRAHRHEQLEFQENNPLGPFEPELEPMLAAMLTCSIPD